MILAGGSGTRLWPASREELPKQFLSILDSAESPTLLQQTVERMKKFSVRENGLFRIIASKKWNSLIRQQCSAVGMNGDVIFEEPSGRNTAPAIALGIVRLLQAGADQDDTVLICPSDQLIIGADEFAAAVACAENAAAAGKLVTFGVHPNKPETGYGYIKIKHSEGDWYDVESFVEKPDLAAAQKYIQAGTYVWNAGIFCFRLKDGIAAYHTHFPESTVLFDAANADCAAIEEAFIKLPSISIDYAVMERAKNIACVRLAAIWSDVGSWDAVYENLPHDEHDNALTGDVVLHNSNGNLVKSDGRLIAGINLQNMLVVDTRDALFIAARDSSQNLRTLLSGISEKHHDEVCEAPFSSRPWGSYEVLVKGGHYKVKRLVVLPGKRLSLQYHLHRSEHWVVVRGTATIECFPLSEESNKSVKFVHEGESIFISTASVHRLANDGKIPCEVIEVQIGAYLGEDDIQRLADDFERSSES